MTFGKVLTVLRAAARKDEGVRLSADQVRALLAFLDSRKALATRAEMVRG